MKSEQASTPKIAIHLEARVSKISNPAEPISAQQQHQLVFHGAVILSINYNVYWLNIPHEFTIESN